MLEQDYIALSKLRLDNAKADCNVTEDNFKLGHYKAANNRAYYAVFHSIRAVLALDKVDFKSHAKVLGYFNKQYTNTGVFDKEFSKIIMAANKARTGSDYNDRFIATREETEKILKGAKKFHQAVETYLVHCWEKYQNQEEFINRDIEKLNLEASVATGNTVTVKVIAETLEEQINENISKISHDRKIGHDTKDLAVEVQEMKNFRTMVDKVNDRNYSIKIDGAATAENIMAQKINIGKQISSVRAKEKENVKNLEKER